MTSIDHARLLVKPAGELQLDAFDPASTGGFHSKQHAEAKLAADIAQLATLQDVFAASGAYALLIILQGMDTAGKDGAIKHVLTGVNPQGIDVTGFKVPSANELAHDYLWRCANALPPRGRIGIFNRSYYEELIVTRVHPDVLAREDLPSNGAPAPQFWRHRFEDINAFEHHLTRNGTVILKFFLHLSNDEQRERLLARIDTSDKTWKLSVSDISERSFWPAYQRAYEEALGGTSTAWAPWYIIPADHKWFSRLAIASVIVASLDALKLAYPTVSDAQRAHLADLAQQLSADQTSSRRCSKDRSQSDSA
jgi:PPK2 family polyphosphate:nucleotide phosphotransferase